MTEENIWNYFSDNMKVAIVIYRLDRTDNAIVDRDSIKGELDRLVRDGFTEDRLDDSFEKLRDYGVIDVRLSERQLGDYERIYTINNVVLETIKGAYLEAKEVLEQEGD